jgi:SAM-dependent methyltransferase
MMPVAADEWFADESFWVTTFPFMFPPSRMEAAGAEVDDILALVQRSAGSVLDLACGPGRHSIALAKRGFAVTGVDRSAYLLGHARHRGGQDDATVEWVQTDMREFVRPGAFDLALCLFTSFGFFRDHADNQKVLDHVAASLKPGGAFVLDMAGKEVLARIFNPSAVRDVPGGLVIHRREVVNDWTQMQNEWILVQDGAVRRLAFRHWIYSAREIGEMFHQAGFDDVRTCGDLRGTPYGSAAERLVVIGRKAAGVEEPSVPSPS